MPQSVQGIAKTVKLLQRARAHWRRTRCSPSMLRELFLQSLPHRPARPMDDRRGDDVAHFHFHRRNEPALLGDDRVVDRDRLDRPARAGSPIDIDIALEQSCRKTAGHARRHAKPGRLRLMDGDDRRRDALRDPSHPMKAIRAVKPVATFAHLQGSQSDLCSSVFIRG